MGIQETWHEYLDCESVEKYEVEYKNQLIKQNQREKFEKTKNNYKLSETLYSSAKLDSDLLSMVINDPGYHLFSNETKALILESKLASLKPLMVNACSASRQAELKGYQDEEKKYTTELERISNSNHTGPSKQSQKKKTAPSSNPSKATDEWFKTTSQFLQDLFILSPIQVVKWVGELNLYRLIVRFSQISWKNIWTYLQSLGILDANSKMHGFFINIAMMDYPAPIFNALSVLIFALKLAMLITLPLKHAFAPTNKVELAFSLWERAGIEITRAWDSYANDIFWMIFNGITNFPLLVGLSIPVANWILVGALFFDVTLLSVLLYKEEKKLNAEHAWLQTQIAKASISSNESRKEMYTAMQQQAQISKISNRAAMIACIIATAIFIASMALILSLTTPLMAPIGFFACVLAVAIILTRKDIASYAAAKASQHIFKDQQRTQNERAEHARQAGVQLAKSLAEFVFIPMIIIGLYTISLPAALAFTAIYISVKASGIKLTSHASNDKTEQRIENESAGYAISLQTQ